MDPSYQNVVDTGDMIFTLAAYALHSVAVAAHLGLAGFLLFTGAYALLRPGPTPGWLQRFGVTTDSGGRSRALRTHGHEGGRSLLARRTIGSAATWDEA